MERANGAAAPSPTSWRTNCTKPSWAPVIVPPFVLVGHSFGGLLAQFYAMPATAPTSPGWCWSIRSTRSRMRASPPIGVDLPKDPHALLGGTSPMAAAYGLPPELRALAIDLAETHKARVFVVREFIAMPAIAADVRAGGDAEPADQGSGARRPRMGCGLSGWSDGARLAGHAGGSRRAFPRARPHHRGGILPPDPARQARRPWLRPSKL